MRGRRGPGREIRSYSSDSGHALGHHAVAAAVVDYTQRSPVAAAHQTDTLASESSEEPERTATGTYYCPHINIFAVLS